MDGYDGLPDNDRILKWEYDFERNWWSWWWDAFMDALALTVWLGLWLVAMGLSCFVLWYVMIG